MARDRDGDRHERDRRDRSPHKKAKKSKDKKRHHRHRRDEGSGSDSDAARGLPRGVAPIGDDDFFLRATEFRVWLKKRRDQYLEELSTDEATRLFQTKFAKRWNAGRLDRMYYEGIPESVLESTKRTRHAWGFVQKLNDRERMDLATAKDSVGVATRKSDLLVETAGPSRGGGLHRHVDAPTSAPVKRPRREDQDDDEGDDERRRRRRAEDKRMRKHHDSVLEELVPRETGREAMLEKRRHVADKLHGAARDRDANRDGLDLDDAFLMGGGTSNELQRRLGHRADARQRRDDELRERAAAAQAKETARMDKFLQDLGIAPNGGRPITIQPRNDTN